MDNNRMFVNPYNFVPLGDGSKRPQTSSEKRNLTGEIICTLDIKTPLAIPDTAEQPNDDKKPKYYGFMSVGGKYIIPGSEIRGMVRNIYETITDSCLSVVNSNIITKRDNTPLKKLGLLFWDSEYKGWTIWEANREKGSKWALEKKKEEMTEKGIPFVERTWNALSSGIIKTSIFYDIGEAGYAVDDEIVENLINVLNSYIENNENKTRQYEAVIPKKDGDLYPVYFSLGGDSGETVTLVLPAQISRRAYNKVINMLGVYAPCEDINNLCPGCSLFGSIIKNAAKASRVRFCDAEPSKDSGVKITEDYVPLKILSSPHLNSTEFYSIPNGIGNFSNVPRWEYNYKGVSLRGRKFYLHNPKAATDPSVYSEKEIIYSESGKPLNSAYKLAESGKFTFKVYFDHISRSELQSLVWSLTLGNEDGSKKYCHKLGHGKPLGLGSVLITVNEIKTRTVTEGYKIESATAGKLMNDYKPPIYGTSTLAALLTMCDYTYADGENIAYPLGQNKKGEVNTMHWFSLNHGAIGSKQPFKNVLHPVVDDAKKTYPASDLRLPFLAFETQSQNRPAQQRQSQSNALSQQSGELKDKELKCKGCGKFFTYTVQWQKNNMQKGWTSEPKWCKECKAKRQNNGGNY